MKQINQDPSNDHNTVDPALRREADDNALTGRAVSRRDIVRYLTSVGVAGVTGGVLAGCGNGSNTGGPGRATLVITWPSSSSRASRLIPLDASSIVVSFSQNSTIASTQTVARPTTTTTSTLTFSSLPAGILTLQATAYPTTDGTGVAQATATTSVTIVASHNTAVSLTMASTIDHLNLTPSSPSVAVGSTAQLTMTAVDASGSIVLTSASTVTWTSLSTGIATVSTTGLVTGVAIGTAQITVTESESGKTATVTVTVTASTAHTVTPEGEIGPYFTDDSATGYNRSNILTNLDGTSQQAGIPLTLKIYVYDTENSNAALAGAQVDIWHCNASGVYSNEASESTTGQSWLRGYQLTDATGLVTFTTIVPGWYAGRTTHIHLRVRSKYSEASSTTDGTNTTQVFFPQTNINYINSNVASYNSHGTNSTTNANDHVYTPETQGTTLLTLSGDYTSGFTSTFAVYLPITSE
jgi:protocatechuate 3,4-dioxygenase beta subunit